MKTRSNLSKYAAQRATLSDMLPFETPPSFGNGGYFHFISQYNVKILHEKGAVYVDWDCPDGRCDAAIMLIFGISDPLIACIENKLEFGKQITRQRVKMDSRALRTQPFHFEIAHRDNESRRLSIVHPRNQLEVANFYEENAELIIYFAGLSPFSLRKPARIAKDVYYDDNLHRKRLGDIASQREENQKEYQYLSSFFAYEKYSNVFRFYESYGYHKAERSFSRLLKLDVSKCFDSIYTHTLPWALLGKSSTKDNLNVSKRTFGGRFDELMQNLNNGETNGIVIGPEFSRIFAELILQNIDIQLQSCLSIEEGMRNKVDYEIFRYVDDFFVFHHDVEHGRAIERHLGVLLREFKLNLNAQKATVLEKPIITSLTIAKNRVQNLLAERIEKTFDIKKLDGHDDEVEIFHPKINANKLIVEFKTILKETNTTYQDNLNYTFSAIEKAFNSINSMFRRNRSELRKKNVHEFPSEQNLIDALVGLLEFSFFIYSSAQRVNFTVRLTRSICFVVDALNEMGIADDVKNQFFKFAHDSIVRILKYNRIEKYREVETLYLVLALKKLGRNYRIELTTLASYFGFKMDDKGDYIPQRSLTVFSITTMLLIIRNIARYGALKNALEKYVVDTCRRRSAYAHKDAEMMILYLDITTCPYVSEPTKIAIDALFGMTAVRRQAISTVNKYWFTNWESFDLTLELDKKRARQVY